MKEIELYINEQLVEFDKEPSILYNYTQTDLTNPTVVKNSFSKTITIEGTNANNAIFGNIWNMERLQAYSAGVYSGAYFNPLQKANFALYVNGELYESGYVKLDEIIKKESLITYNISLFGGLGSFFYNLTYSHDDNGEVDGPDKLRLSDLQFASEGEEEPDLSFYINKDTVKEAWDYIGNYSGKWGVINFAPCYNGLPNDFDSNKCLVNSKNMLSGSPFFVFSDSGYTTVNGYALGEMNEEMTEWEVRDLRSYLQRPVIRMKSIIDACCNPANNGGFQVKLDSHFFDTSWDDRNPYYEESWVTLPMLRDLVEGGQVVSATTATLAAPVNGAFYKVNTNISMASFTNVNFGLTVSFTPRKELSSDVLYSSYQYKGNRTKRGKTQRVESVQRNGAVLVQLLAYDASNVIVGASNTYYLYTPGSGLQPDMAAFKTYWENKGGASGSAIKYLEGIYKKVGNKYVFSDANGNEMALGFSLITQTPFDYLQLKIMPVSTLVEKYREADSFLSYQGDTTITYGGTAIRMGEVPYYYYDGNKTLAEVTNIIGGDYGSFDYEIVDFKLIGEDIETLFSDTFISKEDLLSSDNTPCDYLLSYCKMFGLYFYKDPSEVADDIERYPNGVIHIMDREDFYQKSVIIDINDIIDRSKEIKITPQLPETKWYDFNVEQADSEANDDYKSSHGYDYGLKRVNTGYNFDAEKTDLLEDNMFKSGVEVLEQSKYYQASISDLPSYVWNGFKYTLFKQTSSGYDTLDKDFLVMDMPGGTINPDGLKNTDMFPKVQLHGKKNDPSDGENILLFYRGTKSSDNSGGAYYISDDLHEMVELNDAKACWLMTASEVDKSGKKIAHKRYEIPYFSRNLVYKPTGNIIATWDLGSSDVTYVTNTYITSPMSIYDKCWKTYIEDMYNVNSRKLTCNCLLTERPNPTWLRRFYWFDNSIWRLNAIKDWNVASYDSTTMEFVKVQDVNNYTNKKLTTYGEVKIILETNEISSGGGIVKGSISLQDGGYWYFADGGYVTFADGTTSFINIDGSDGDDGINVTPLHGNGNTAITIEIPENNSYESREFTIMLSPDYPEFRDVKATIKQLGKSEIQLSPEDIVGISAAGGEFSIDVWYRNRGDKQVIFDHNESYDYLKWELSQWEGEHAILNVTVDANNSIYSRSNDYIAIMDRDDMSIRKTLGVQQLGAKMEIDKNNVVADEEGDTIFVKVITDATEWSYKNVPTWIYITQSEEGMTLEVSSNLGGTDRSADIYLTIGGRRKMTFNIVQYTVAPELEINPSTMTFTTSGGTQHLSVNTNARYWNYEKSAGWISLDNFTENGCDIIVNENNAGESRTAYIDIYIDEGLNRQLVINQEFKTMFSTEPETLILNPEGGTTTIKIISNKNWNIDE